MKTYELPLTRAYVRDWTSVEAIRELLQNNIDFGDGKLTAEVGETAITITSPGARLEPRSLLLGHTTKADDDKAIGSFGEGYKIALLVLAREGAEVNIFNDGLKWNAELRHSDTFGEEVLFVDEVESSFGAGAVEFAIFGLQPEVMVKVIENTLQLQSDLGVIHTTSHGDIMIDRPGKLYVNGLFVCDTELVYGYNMKPEHIKLERDRQTVDSWDLRWMTAKMWGELDMAAQVAEMLKEGIPDVELIQHGAPRMVREAAYQLFIKMHPGAVIASSQAELEQIMKDKLVREVKVYSSSYTNIVRSHPDYEAGAPKRVVLTPEGVLKAFLAEQRKNMNRKSIEAFNDVIKKATNWK